MKLGLLARIEARPEHAQEVAEMLAGATAIAEKEGHTVTWYAYRLDATTFGVFDTFADESGRQTHLHGPIATALMAKAPELFAKPPSIEPVEILGAKQPG